MASTPTSRHPGTVRPRRRLLLAAAGMAAGLGAPLVHAQPSSTIRLRQSIALSGPLADLGQAVHNGAKACFDALNAQGGVNGAKIELVARDDAYEVQRSVQNLHEFMADSSLFALFSCLGTPMVEAALPLLKGTDVPYFAPFTGARAARPKDFDNVFNVRASYAEETEQLVQHISTVGPRRIAVVYQNNSFGKEVLLAAQASLVRRGLAVLAAETIDSDGRGAEAAAKTLAGVQPEAVLMALAGRPTVEFVRHARALRRSLPLYALSVLGGAGTLTSLGHQAVGITVSQVVPLPTNTMLPVVRDFLQAWRWLGSTIEPSHMALEGYINARVFIEALRRAGRNPSRTDFIQATWGLKRFDLGGFLVNFSGPGSNASHFVDLTMVGRGGRFIR
ncbi:ABC transporter substrate-binding protein [Aquabacterium sp. A7-Y]|uniref:ABC transporter substrate-binding protein n=1 Tax=Aquabacterium sp. A7-Y TaxID=1349605 RepID=UPI00223DAE33|nr:ABC transporter substrate-binding protein [Aquabacterium sp. A7-Y]MCW7539022.1 ABC transporter substrate-binding protein [Aquabacterium sp. A7-Y]